MRTNPKIKIIVRVIILLLSFLGPAITASSRRGSQYTRLPVHQTLYRSMCQNSLKVPKRYLSNCINYLYNQDRKIKIRVQNKFKKAKIQFENNLNVCYDRRMKLNLEISDCHELKGDLEKEIGFYNKSMETVMAELREIKKENKMLNLQNDKFTSKLVTRRNEYTKAVDHAKTCGTLLGSCKTVLEECKGRLLGIFSYYM